MPKDSKRREGAKKRCQKYHQVRGLGIPMSGSFVVPKRRNIPEFPDRPTVEAARPHRGWCAQGSRQGELSSK